MSAHYYRLLYRYGLYRKRCRDSREKRDLINVMNGNNKQWVYKAEAQDNDILIKYIRRLLEYIEKNGIVMVYVKE
jgi:hypothetical protein